MSKPRAEVKIGELPDVSNFKVQTGKKTPLDKEIVEKNAETAGFSTRHATNPSNADNTSNFDARTLRRTGRTAKLNIAVKPSTRDKFWALVQDMGLSSGEDGLIHMMDAFEKKQS